MGNDQALTVALIEAVKKNPMLYDTNVPDYKNPQRKREVWDEIAGQINGKSGHAMQWKWKQLRDSYAKHLKNISANTDDQSRRNKYIHWRWAPYMTFLGGHFRKQKCISANAPDLPVANPNTFYVEINDDAIKTKNENHKRKHEETNDGMHDLPGASSHEFLDKTDYLFLSYADTFKKLSPRTQAVLKLRIAKIFAVAELQELNSESATKEVMDPIKCEQTDTDDSE